MTLWVIGGMDPSGGAGVLRDVWSVRQAEPALRCHTVVAAWTWQNGWAPARASAVDQGRMRARMASLPPPQAIKIGLVCEGVVEAILEQLGRHRVPVVLDPVMVASDGGAIGPGVASLSRLIERVELVTPNLPEGAALLDEPALVEDPDTLLTRLRERFPDTAVLLKGGHATGALVCDRLAWGHAVMQLERPRKAGPAVRGTGCALASAIASHRATGMPIMKAVNRAIDWLDHERTLARPGRDGQLHLPVHRLPHGP